MNHFTGVENKIFVNFSLIYYGLYFLFAGCTFENVVIIILRKLSLIKCVKHIKEPLTSTFILKHL